MSKPRPTSADLYLWQDDGCDEAPACLTCPLARCVLDRPPIPNRRSMEAFRLRAVRARHLKEQGKPVDAIARELGVSKRAAFRALAAAR